MKPENDFPVLHVYPHYAPHTDLHIMGNRTGLLLLTEALLQALLEDKSSNTGTPGASTTDGEGFDIVVHLEQDDGEQNSYVLPYTAAEYQDQEPNPDWPRKNIKET